MILAATPLRWGLAEAAGVSNVTVRQLEAEPGPLAAGRSAIAKLGSAFESAGIVFIKG